MPLVSICKNRLYYCCIASDGLCLHVAAGETEDSFEQAAAEAVGKAAREGSVGPVLPLGARTEATEEASTPRLMRLASPVLKSTSGYQPFVLCKYNFK